mgnify:CR=1 FL=1
MPAGLLSAALIVRNEESVLDACLESLRGIVDETVVVDTGSTDRSPSIAKRHGARLLALPWSDDFSAARNHSLQYATSEWILYIDADERLVGSSRGTVEQLLRGAREIAFRILLRPHREMTPYLEYRLWRNDPRIRFEGSIHERVVPAIHRVARIEDRPIGDCHILLIDHVGYEGDQTRKHLRNLPMLERFVAEEPGHLFAQHHLAKVLDGVNRRDEAEQVLTRTIELIRSHELSDPVGVLAYASLIERLHASGREFRALLSEARARYPDNCVLLWIEGRDLIGRGEYAAALAVFERVLTVGAVPPAVGLPAYDRRLIGEEAYASKALCLFRLGRYAEAADAYGEASRCAPDDATYELRRKLALSRCALQ